MQRSLAILLALAASLFGNLALLAALKRAPAPASEQMPEADLPDADEKPALTAIKPSKHFRTALATRAGELRELGLPEKHIAAALIPNLTRHLRSECLQHKSVQDCAKALSQARGERRNWIEQTFPEISHRDWTDNPYSVDRDRLKLGFEFDEVTQSPGASSDAGQIAGSANSLGNDQAPAEGPEAIHAVLSKVGGVRLDQEEKSALVEIAQTHCDDPEKLAAELSQASEQPMADQLLRCLDPDYHHSYQRAIAVSDDLAERERFATTLAEIRRTRLDGLERWQTADLSDAQKSAGRRTVESQIQNFLREELGEIAIELIRANGW